MSASEQQVCAIIGGIDCHKDAHVVAAVDVLGHLVGTKSFPTTAEGYRNALAWLRTCGPIVVVGVESTGSYGAALTRAFRAADVRVVEVNQPHPHLRARRGKSDAVDAEAAARKVLSGEAAGAAKDSTGIVECIRHLTVVRDGAIKARTAALSQLDALVVTAPADVRRALSVRRSLEGKVSICARLRPDRTKLTAPSNAIKLALRSVATRIAQLASEAKGLAAELDALIARAAPTTRQQLGLGTHNTATLLVAVVRST